MSEHYTYRAALDNHEPTRNYIAGHLEHWTADDHENKSGTECWKIITPSSQLKDADRALYILDDGHTVTPVYVVGWNYSPRDGGAAYILLQRFPISEGTRPDNGRPVDMSGWMLGPRRAYHFKLTPLAL